MESGFFRSKSGYTVVQNAITRDRTVSLKAKGLYLVIQAYITMPDKKWRKDDFMEISTDGKKAFGSAWDELKEKGFLKVHMLPNGNCWCVEYELLDEPQDGPHTFYYNKAGEVTKTNIDRANAREEKKIIEENKREQKTVKIEEDLRTPPFGSNAKGSNVKGNNVKGNNAKGIYAMGSNAKGGNNNKSYQTKPNTTTVLNPSINLSSENIAGEIVDNSEKDLTDGQTDIILPCVNLDYKEPMEDWLVDDIKEDLYIHDGIDKYIKREKEVVIPLIQYLCQWDEKCCRYSEMQLESYVMIVEAICEMILTPVPMILSNQSVSSIDVINQLNKCIRNSDMAHDLSFFVGMVMERYVRALSEFTIRNPKSYAKSVIWNCFGTYMIDFNSNVEKLIHNYNS